MADWLSRRSLAHLFAMTRYLERENEMLRAQLAEQARGHLHTLQAERAAWTAERKQMLDRLAPPLVEDDDRSGWGEVEPQHPMARLAERGGFGQLQEEFIERFLPAFLAEKQAESERAANNAYADRSAWEIETGQLDPMR